MLINFSHIVIPLSLRSRNRFPSTRLTNYQTVTTISQTHKHTNTLDVDA